ncbi:MAG TPA: MFS transporter [Polyangia bacterium]|nr:MFS transporter [Polyangia bacterium]
MIALAEQAEVPVMSPVEPLPAPSPPGPSRATRRAWIGLAVLALPCLLYAMDLTVLNLALPRLSEDLRPSSAKLLWIVDIYGFFVAAMLVTMGNLGDRIGRRRLLLIGAAAFGAASVLAAFSRSAGMLIAARAVLGVAGATLAPSTLSLIRNMFLDPRQRRTAIGVWISSYSVGGAMGPLLGGVLLQHLPWGSVFLLAVPVMALLLLVGPVLLPEYRDPQAGSLDLGGALLSLLSVLLAVYGLKELAQDGWGWLPALSMAGGLTLGALFVRRQRRVAAPLIDLRLFRAPAFSASLVTYMLATLVSFGSYVMIGQYLQLVLGLTPLAAGLWTLPWSAGFIAGSMLAPPLTRWMRPAFLMAGGLVLAGLGFAVTASVPSSGLAGLTAGTLLMSLGLAPVITVGTDLVVGAAPPARAGAAAAISETSSELGGALGIAILGSIGTAIYRGRVASAALGDLPAAARHAARDTLGGAMAAAAQLPGDLGLRLAAVARQAFSAALQVTVMICALVCVLAAALVMIALRGAPGAGESPGPDGTVGEP